MESLDKTRQFIFACMMDALLQPPPYSIVERNILAPSSTMHNALLHYHHQSQAPGIVVPRGAAGASYGQS